MGNELEALRAKIASLEIENKKLSDQSQRALGGELGNIQRQARRSTKGGTGAINYKETLDYVPMTLYHANGVNIGKFVGPMHPGSAEDTYMRFALKGTILSVKKPTDAEVEAYKQTAEYQDLISKELKRRQARIKTVKESSIDRLTKEIEKLSGKKIVNSIKKQEDVK